MASIETVFVDWMPCRVRIWYHHWHRDEHIVTEYNRIIKESLSYRMPHHDDDGSMTIESLHRHKSYPNTITKCWLQPIDGPLKRIIYTGYAWCSEQENGWDRKRGNQLALSRAYDQFVKDLRGTLPTDQMTMQCKEHGHHDVGCTVGVLIAIIILTALFLVAIFNSIL